MARHDPLFSPPPSEPPRAPVPPRSVVARAQARVEETFRLNIVERFGIVVTPSRVWAAPAWESPLLALLLRRHRGPSVDRWLILSFWLGLLGVELMVLSFNSGTQAMAGVLGLLVVEILLVAPVVGLFSTFMAARAFNHAFRQMPLDELMVTPIPAQQIAYVPGLLAVLWQNIGITLASGALLMAYLEAGSGAPVRDNWAVTVLAVIGVAVLLFRYYFFQALVSFGAACALRACFFLRRDALKRAVWDYAFGAPAMLFSILLGFAIIGCVFFLASFLVGMGPIASVAPLLMIIGCVLVIAGPVALMIVGELLEGRSAAIMRFVAERRDRWGAVEEWILTPKGLRDPWPT